MENVIKTCIDDSIKKLIELNSEILDLNQNTLLGIIENHGSNKKYRYKSSDEYSEYIRINYTEKNIKYQGGEKIDLEMLKTEPKYFHEFLILCLTRDNPILCY